MNKKYLNEIRYNWEQDKRGLKIDGILPAARCIICGRIFLNAENAIVFCKICDKAMSICKDGPEQDYDTFGTKIKMKDLATNQIKTINLIARREIRTPIEFNEEGKYFNKNSKGPAEEPHFITAAGKIIPTEADEDADSDLYKMGLDR